MTRRGRVRVGLVVAVAVGAAWGGSEPSCEHSPEHALLDFWAGDWNVCVAGAYAGHDRVTRILDGCAVTEEWTGADGLHGFGLFYYVPAQAQWKQVWVTDQAARPGGLKEKHLIARRGDGETRFQGEIALPGGERILDRTTLRRAASGAVLQTIEISRDGGDRWTTTFDSEYRRAPPQSAGGQQGDAACR